MSSTTTDRRLGLTGSAAIKVPCKAATTANITLSAAQTIDGVSCVAGDRVLVRSQTSSVDNGIYVVDTGTWTRDLDFDGVADVVTGTIVMVLNGSTNANTYWRLTTTGTVTFGSSAITFAAALAGDSTMVNFLPSGTGAVATDLQTRGRLVVYVWDYMSAAQRTDFTGGTGSLDITTPIQNAIAAMPNGGDLIFPSGKGKVTDVSALTANIHVKGAGGVNFIDGSPVPSASGTFLWQATAAKAIFSIGAGASHVTVSDIALAPALMPTHVPLNDGRIGISLSANTGQSIWNISFERVLFYNLDYGIKVNDPGAPQTQDWSVAPVKLTQCYFEYPLNGVYINTNNADDWVYDTCIFFPPTNGIAVYLSRFGYQHFKDCFCGAASVSGNKFIYIVGTSTLSVDDVTVENCQAETLANSIHLDSTGGYAVGGSYLAGQTFTLTVKNCIFELSAAVNLQNTCEYVSIGNRYSTSVKFTTSTVTPHSYNDWFVSGNHFVFSGGAALYTHIPGISPDSNIGAVVYLTGGPQTGTGGPVFNTNPSLSGTVNLPSGQGSATFSGDIAAQAALSIANNGTAQPYSNANNFSGLVVIKELNGGNIGVFLCGGITTVVLVSQTLTTFSIASGTGAKTNVYFNGSTALEIENKTGSTNTYRVMAFRLASAL